MSIKVKQVLAVSLLAITTIVLAGGCSSGKTPGDAAGAKEKATQDKTLTLYSGREQELVGPILEQFQKDSGIKVDVRYAGTPELAATILEEGSRSPADVFFAQDAGALGAVAREGLFVNLPAATLAKVEPRFSSAKGLWTGVTGRARVVTYNTNRLSPADLPDSILAFTDRKWQGRIGWPPTNASFQAFVTALRLTKGEDTAREWLKGIQANNPKAYPKNTAAVEAVANGEVDVAFVNHYYLMQLKAKSGPNYPAANYYFEKGGPGALINVAGVAILKSSKKKGAAEELVNYLLSETAQRYFAEKTFEYPLVKGIAIHKDLPPLKDIQTPDIDLSNLSNLEQTLDLLQDTGVLR